MHIPGLGDLRLSCHPFNLGKVCPTILPKGTPLGVWMPSGFIYSRR